MNALFQWGGHPVVHRLGWTLLYFLWQGAVVAGLFAIAQTGLRRSSSNARYLIGCLALALMLAAPVLTFIALGDERKVPATLAASGPQSSPASQPVPSETAGALVQDGQRGQGGQHGQHRAQIPPSPNPQSAIRNPQSLRMQPEKFIPAFVLAWLLGVSALSLRLLFSSLQVARWKRRGNEPPGAPWLERLDRLKAALQISRPVRLVKSALFEVPAVVGWLRPVILLPSATLAGLTPAQLEVILAHELAHVRRHDYLVNLLQNALETLLFYHPAVWWVSSCVRVEREICCDEIAVRLCGDRVVYARALAALEQLRAGGRALALGADGSSLLERIRRLSGAPSAGSLPARRRAGGALVAALVAPIFISVFHHSLNNAKAQATSSAATNQTNMQGSIAPKPPGAPNGTVLLPNGQPAAGAELVLQLTNDLLWLHMPNGFLTENGVTNRPTNGAQFKSAFAIADDGGHFHFPAMENAAALLAIHPQGFAWMASNDLKSEMEVRLEPFGRIEGTFRLGIRPGSNEQISLNADDPRLHLFTGPIRTMTDSAGRFVFTNLPAIQFGLARMFRMDPPATNRGQYALAVAGWIGNRYANTMSSRGWAGSSERVKVLVKGGETTEVELGGTGRPVVGKAAKAGMAFDWSQAHVQLLQRSLPAPEVQRYMARIAEDGAFRVENVGAGDYDLGIYVSPDDGKSNILYTAPDYLALARKVVVPEMAGGRSQEALDLGRLEIQHPQADHRIKVGEQAPAVSATNFVPSFDGGQFDLSNDPGKYVLLDLCGNYYDKDLSFLQAAHEAFAQDNRLVMASVTLGYLLQEVPRRPSLTIGSLLYDGSGSAPPGKLDPWSHAYTGPIQTAEWAEAYGLLDQNSMVRQIVLIGPDGKILAKDLHGDGIKAAVVKELESKPDSKGQTAPPLVPPSGKTNAGEVAPTSSIKTNAAAEISSPQSPIRNPQPVNFSKPATNSLGISLEIRCTNEVLKVGDEIPIEFIISNHGPADFHYLEPMPYPWVEHEIDLVAKTAAGESVPKPPPHDRPFRLFSSPFWVLHAGESFTRTFPLNLWALIKEPGRYQVMGVFLGRRFGGGQNAPVNSDPIGITVLPRTKEEMDDYVRGLTNQVAARLPIQANQNGGHYDPVLDELLMKLMYTCSPNIVPTVLGLMQDGTGNSGWWGSEALMCYVPHSQEIRQAIIAADAKRSLKLRMDYFLQEYDGEPKPVQPVETPAQQTSRPLRLF